MRDGLRTRLPHLHINFENLAFLDPRTAGRSPGARVHDPPFAFGYQSTDLYRYQSPERCSTTVSYPVSLGNR